MVDLTIKDAHANGGGCGCGGHGGGHGHGNGGCGCGCGGHQKDAAPAKGCACGSDCTCGCQDGKPCTCGAKESEPIRTEAAGGTGASAKGAEYTVSGMTCEHCVKAITEEVSAIPGVKAVDVDLQSGRMRVDSDQPVDFDRIVEAVAEAGDYTVE